MSNFQKINDLSESPVKSRFDKKQFVAESNLAVVVGRVSIKKNKDKGNSDVDQNEVNLKYLKENNLILAREPWDIAETASDHEKRKHFIEMIDFVEDSQQTKRPVKHVIFAYTSRATRNKKSKRMIEALLDLGVSVHFPLDRLVLNKSSDMGDWITWEVKSLQDQDYVERLKRVTWGGTVKRLELGLFPGKAPFGYRNTRLSKLGGMSIFTFEKREAEFMKKYFEMFATELYSQLELIKILAPSFPDIELLCESRMNVQIRNPFYYGDFIYMGQTWKGNPDHHPPLITFGLWKRVQDILSKRERGWREDLSHPYIQLMRCNGRVMNDFGTETEEVCGCSITAENKQKPLKGGGFNTHYYYRCSSRMSKQCSQRNGAFMKAHGMKKVSYTEAELENLFLQVIRPLTFDQERVEWMRSMLIKHHREVSSSENQQLMTKHARYHQLFQFRERAYEDRLNGVIASDSWKEKDERWRSEQGEIQNELTALKDNLDERINQGIALIELLEGTETTWQKASKESKARILKIVVSDLTLRNGSIEYKYKKPFDMLVKGSSFDKWSG